MHRFFSIPLPITPEKCRRTLLYSSQDWHYACLFDGNGQSADPYGAYDLIAAFGKRESPVRDYRRPGKGWHFGFLSYDLKNELEELRSRKKPGYRFPGHFFFIPDLVLLLKGDRIKVGYHPASMNITEAKKRVGKMLKAAGRAKPEQNKTPRLRSRFTRSEYVQTVKKLQKHILRGDIYEVNFCQEFYSEGKSIDPFEIFLNLNGISHSPFSAFCRFGDNYLLSSSPERYLAKKGNTLVSQPIKGTARRGKTKAEDEKIKSALRADAKEQSENVMIVDLVRNDLSRIAKPGTVKVEELFGIYTFNQVHQMISTVSCRVDRRKTFSNIIRATFPMGSMTGAPKVSAMKLIEKYERSRRGLYSGAVGYIAPNGDFDLSVVIRSIIYNAKTKYLSFSVGSAITAASDPAKEYDECLLKAKGMIQALGKSGAGSREC